VAINNLEENIMSKWAKRVLSVLLACVLVGGAVPIGIINVAAEFTTTPMVAAGGAHSLALKSNGTVWAWGSNYRGELGDGNDGPSTIHRTPIQALSLSGITAIAAGGSHSLALKSDGTVWAWGDNDYGQLGRGFSSGGGWGFTTPEQVTALSDVIAIAGGRTHSLALKSNGTVWAWGDNLIGQLGDGTTIDRCTAVQVLGLSGVKAIAAGSHSLALKNDGTVWEWGGKYTRPVQILSLGNVIAIAAGLGHYIALKNDGTVWAWGMNGDGQLGDRTTTNRDTPVQTLNLINVTAIAAGSFSSIALKSNGTVWAWGNNNSGQLGDGTTTNRTTAVQVLNLSDAIAITNTSGHSLALNSDGTVRAWGNNSSGQLGDNSFTDHYTPAQVVGENNVGYFYAYGDVPPPAVLENKLISFDTETNNIKASVPIGFSDNLFNVGASFYKHELALAGSVLSAAAYDKKYIKSGLEELLFDHVEQVNYETDGSGNQVAYSFGVRTCIHKQTML